MPAVEEAILKSQRLRARARLGGGEDRIAAQHEKGRYTARERIEMLLDEGSFEEFDPFVTHRCNAFGMERQRLAGDGVVCGFGTINCGQKSTSRRAKGSWRVTCWSPLGASAMLAFLHDFLANSGFPNLAWGNVAMAVVGGVFIIPFPEGMRIGYREDGTVLNVLYDGVRRGWFPPLIFLGIGAMTDFSALLSNAKLLFLGAAAQVGIFATLLGALAFDFSAPEAGAIGIIGGADGPTAIFLSAKLAPHLLSAIAVSAYSYMALVPVIQPPIMRVLTTERERRIRMKPPRTVSKREKILFPIIGSIATCFIVPGALNLLGMLFFGNLLKELGVTERLATTARTALIDTVTIILGFSVRVSTEARSFLTSQSLLIFALGALSFAVATAGGVLLAKGMNLFLADDNKINPLIGARGVSAVPDAARVVHQVGQECDKSNFLLMHAMGPNVAGVIGSAIAAGVLWPVLSKLM